MKTDITKSIKRQETSGLLEGGRLADSKDKTSGCEWMDELDQGLSIVNQSARDLEGTIQKFMASVLTQTKVKKPAMVEKLMQAMTLTVKQLKLEQIPFAEFWIPLQDFRFAPGSTAPH